MAVRMPEHYIYHITLHYNMILYITIVYCNLHCNKSDSSIETEDTQPALDYWSLTKQTNRKNGAGGSDVDAGRSVLIETIPQE